FLAPTVTSRLSHLPRGRLSYLLFASMLWREPPERLSPADVSRICSVGSITRLPGFLLKKKGRSTLWFLGQGQCFFRIRPFHRRNKPRKCSRPNRWLRRSKTWVSWPGRQAPTIGHWVCRVSQS